MRCARACSDVLAWLSKLAFDTNLGVTVLIGMAIAVAAWERLPWRGPPVTITNLRAYTIPVGERFELLIVYDIVKTRPCPAEIVRFIVDERGEIRQLGQPTTSFNPPGERRVSLRLALPLLPEGRYQFQTVATYDCRDATYQILSPIGLFSIPGSATPGSDR